MQSQLIQQLTNMRWFGDLDGKWCRPSELAAATLYTGASEEDPTQTFDVSAVSNGWLQLVQFGQSEVKQEAAKTLGLDYSDYQLIEKVKEEDPDFLDKLREQFLPVESVDVADIDFPEQLKESVNKPGKIEIDEQYLNGNSGEVKNPLPREKKLSDEIKADKDHEAKPKPPRLPRLTKSIECKDPQTRQYLLEWYGGKCQMCGKTWAKRNGKPYFVAAYMLEVRKGRWLDRPGNAICLCADHFAQWRHAAKKECYDVANWILEQKLEKEGGVSPLELEFELLGKRVGIKYTEPHLLELRTMVKESNNTNALAGEL